MAGWGSQSRAMAQVPHAARRARGYTRGTAIAPDVFRKHSAPTTVYTAVEGIALGCIPQRDQTLYDLLTSTIGGCAAWAGPAAGRATRCDTAPWVPDRQSRNTAQRPLTQRPSLLAITNGHQQQPRQTRIAADMHADRSVPVQQAPRPDPGDRRARRRSVMTR